MTKEEDDAMKREFLSGHISIGNLTIYGRNAMHWGVTLYTKKYGYICFRLPFRCFGKWWPLYFYCSPNATPLAATFMIGRKNSPGFDIPVLVIISNYMVGTRSLDARIMKF